MLSLEIRFFSVVAPREKAPIKKMFSCYVCFQLRLDFHERKLLLEISYKRGLRPHEKGRCFLDWNWILLCFSKLLLTWSSKYDQQVGHPLFQRNNIPAQQDVKQNLEETNGAKASHQSQLARKSTGENIWRQPWGLIKLDPIHSCVSFPAIYGTLGKDHWDLKGMTSWCKPKIHEDDQGCCTWRVISTSKERLHHKEEWTSQSTWSSSY